MYGDHRFFYGLTRTVLVVDKKDSKLKDGENTVLIVYSTMLLQICRDYTSLPDPRTLTMPEIRFFYDGLRSELKKHG